jgi:phytoene dehydrogenase-like protein
LIETCHKSSGYFVLVINKVKGMVSMENFDAAVIGGGLAGLTASIYLARAGKNVILLEKSSELGGRAKTQNRNGTLFNLGAHALYKEGEANSILRELDVSLKGGTLDGHGLGIRNGKTYPLPFKPLPLLLSKLLSWSGKIEFIRLMTRFGRVDPSRLKETSLQDWVSKEIADPGVQELFYALCRLWTYADAADKQSAASVIRQGQVGMKGVLYLDGGWQVIVDQLKEKAIQAGVTIQHQRVVNIDHDHKVRSLTLTDDQAVEVSAALVAAAPKDLYGLVKHMEPVTLHRWREQAIPVRGACLDIALRKLPNPQCSFAIGIDQPVYYSNHSKVAQLSEDGTIVLHLVKYHGDRPAVAESDEKELEAMLDLIQPKWQSEVVTRRFMPDITISNALVPPLQKGLFDRPEPTIPEIRGLYVAGDWVGSHGALADASLVSAKQAALQMIQDMRDGCKGV